MERFLQVITPLLYSEYSYFLVQYHSLTNLMDSFFTFLIQTNNFAALNKVLEE